MKKLILLFPAILALKVSSQNLQVHYDFGKDRKFITSTLEMFRPDTLGSTFWFVDFDYNLPGHPRSMSGAYWEISREFYIPGLRDKKFFDELTFHLEYNDGFGAFPVSTDTLGAFSYNSVFLTGFSHPVKLGNVIITTQWLCRFARGANSPDFQFTLVWFQPVVKGRILLTGFADLWSQDKIFDPQKKELVIQSEPQIWYLVTQKIGLGGEVEISHNFPAGPNDWQFSPTLAVRWEF